MSTVLTPPLPAAAPTPAPLPVVPVVPPPPAVQLPPQPYRWTLKQYRELNKIGFFDDKRTVLLNGVICVMPNPDPPHDTALSLTAIWLATVFTAGYYIRNQMSFNVGEDTDTGPDLCVVTGSVRDYATAAPTVAVLIVEVSDSTLSADITTKAEKYATAGVPDYWVIDLQHRELIVFRDPVPLPAGLGATAYRQRNTFGPDAVVSPLAVPTASVKVADLLP